MSSSVEELVAKCFDEMQVIQHYQSYAQKAEDEGYPQVAKLFRAVGLSETAREKLFRQGIANHAAETYNYFVCPHCGLIFSAEAPDKCPADETYGAQFTLVS
jgi:rubrerythrin